MRLPETLKRYQKIAILKYGSKLPDSRGYYNIMRIDISLLTSGLKYDILQSFIQGNNN